MTHGRPLPQQCYFARQGETPPLCVSHIMNGVVHIYDPSLPPGTFDLLPFDTSGGLEHNEALFDLLVSLNRSGLPFIYQPKEMGAPEHLMTWWQDVGKLKEAFWLISWREPDIWFKTLIVPPILGLRGWTGPKTFMG